MSEDLILGTILGFFLFVAYDSLIGRIREKDRRKRSFRVLLDELHNITERGDVNITTIQEEMLRLRETADLRIRTLIPLGTLGWDLLRSSGISAALDASTLTRLYTIYNQVDLHNKLLTLRERYIASSVPTVIQPGYIENYDHRILQTAESIKRDIGLVEPEIKKSTDC